jgi:hypothetical protein
VILLRGRHARFGKHVVTNLFRNSAVDGRLKAEFAIRESARAGGEELKKRSPMLQIRIYGAQTNAREEIRIFLSSSHNCVSDSTRAAVAAPGSCESNRVAFRPCGFDPPRRIMCRSPEALARGPRRHCIPASLSRRVPRRRYADAPAAALLAGPRLADGLRLSAAHPSLLVFESCAVGD